MAASKKDAKVDLHPVPSHPRAQQGFVRGVAGWADGRTRGEKAVTRRIGEVLRSLHTAEELGNVLWSVLSGIDPFVPGAGAPHPDGVPMAAPAPIPWNVRLAAGKLYAEYAHGKPVQGVVVDALIQQETTLTVNTSGPIDMRSLPPEVRAALRLAAQAALGRPHAVLESVDRRLGQPGTGFAKEGGILDQCDRNSGERGVQSAEHAGAGGGQRGADNAAARGVLGDRQPDVNDRGDVPLVDDVVNLDDVALFDVDGNRMGAGVGEVEVHLPVPIVGQTEPEVKGIVLDFRGSSNLIDAQLLDGILTVRFRGPNNQPTKEYKYRNVTPEMMDRWRAAPSAGAWFSREIRVRHQQFPLIASGSSARWPGVVL